MTWLPQEAIRAKRDGEELPAEELTAIARGIADGSLSDAQVGAFAMAVQWRGMTAQECANFTAAVRDTGEVFDWRRESPPGPVIDKHSTGGVGDLVSLVLGPMLAACGAWVPMIVGRGLAHTGGTLDKLEAIPGYDSRPSPERVKRAVRAAGVAIVGAGERIAPAERRLYAVRDITATVDCLPLIVASILAKKLAAGLDALVLDIKHGNGAVLPQPERGRELAQAMRDTAAKAGLRLSALLTDMSEPLARSAGNALEVLEATAILRNERVDPRLLEVALALGAEVMQLSGLARDEAAARKALRDALASGAAAERFTRMVASLGGPSDFLERPSAHLSAAPVVRDVPSPASGTIAAIDTRAVGLVVIRLGGGRKTPEQCVDHAVGLDRLQPRGAHVARGDALARVHARTADDAQAAVVSLSAAFTLAERSPKAVPLIERVD